MSQFRSGLEFGGEAEDKSAEQALPGVQDVAEESRKQPAENTDALPAAPVTGRLPVYLLTGSHHIVAVKDTRKIQAAGSDVLMDNQDTTSRMIVIPADKKLQQQRSSQLMQAATRTVPESSAGQKGRWRKTLMVSGLLVFILFASVISRIYFFNPSHLAGSSLASVPCLTGCYSSAHLLSATEPALPRILSTASTSVRGVPSGATPVSHPNGWKLTFDEEFNETGVNWNIWQDGGQNWGSGGHGEQQAYLGSECSVANGQLIVRGEDIPANGKKYSSCMLNTLGTFKQTYGYFEFRGRLPSGQGYWPAFWLYESATDGTPEIDVMENLGNDTRTYYMTYHSDVGDQQQVYHGVDLAAAFHTYAVKWLPDSITFYFDNVAQYTVTNGVYNNPMFILIDLAIGGQWPKSPDASTPFPGYFNVDYVRAYALS